MAEQPQQFHQGGERTWERQGSSQQPGGMAGGDYQMGSQQGGNQQQQRNRGNGFSQRGGQGGGQQASRSSMSIPSIAFRGMGRLYDMQVAATRLMLQTQASAASALGFPDCSGLFRIADDRAKRVFSTGTEELLHLAERTNETTSEIQREVGRLLEVQAVNEAENWQRGLQELRTQAEQSLEEFKELARTQAEEAMRMAEQISQQGQQMMREGGEQMREGMAQAGQQAESAGRQAESSARRGQQQAERDEESEGSASAKGASAGDESHGGHGQAGSKRKST